MRLDSFRQHQARISLTQDTLNVLVARLVHEPGCVVSGDRIVVERVTVATIVEIRFCNEG